MPAKEQAKRYKKVINDDKQVAVKKERPPLKNWQKLSIIGVLTLLCIVAIVVIAYLIIYK